tara:strand:- start:7736 stop:8185 length:450 start_codon:yes stop_codon:yes gene_type:complete
MGKWGPGILGNDDALDEMDAILSICKIEWDDESECYPIKAHLLNEHQEAVAAYAKSCRVENPVEVVYQVWAYLVMNHGAEMTPDMRKDFLQACDDDGQAVGYKERQEVIDDLRSLIENYSGKPEVVEPGKPLLWYLYRLIQRGRPSAQA